MNKTNDERQNLLKRIQIYGFAVVEAVLYLDTHPTDKAALKYHNKYRQMHNDAKKEFEEKFGPLSLADYQPEEKWSWTDEPWPWELEA